MLHAPGNIRSAELYNAASLPGHLTRVVNAWPGIIHYGVLIFDDVMGLSLR